MRQTGRVLYSYDAKAPQEQHVFHTLKSYANALCYADTDVDLVLMLVRLIRRE